MPRSSPVQGLWRLLLLCISAPLWQGAALAAEPYRHLLDIQQADGIPLALPSDVAVSATGRLHIVDGGNHRILSFDRQGEFLRALGSEGSAAEQFEGPVGLGLDAEGNVYVADSGNHRIQVFDPDYHLLRSIPIMERGVGQRPIDVAVSSKLQRMYVTTNARHKVMVYSLQGKYLRSWGGKGNNPGEFRYPATIALNANGDVYVVDVLNSRVQIFDSEGTLIIHAGSWGVLPGQLFRPKGVAVDGAENIYVSDSYMDVIEVFDANKQFRYHIGGQGAALSLTAPVGLAVDRQRRLYVAQMLANRVSIYAPQGGAP